MSSANYLALLAALWITMVESLQEMPASLNETCVDGLALARFNELSVMYGISGGSGPCHVRREDVANESADAGSSNGIVCSTCQPVAGLCTQLVDDLNATVQRECVLTQAASACTRAEHSNKAYGYGVAMLLVVLVTVTAVSFVLAKLGQRLKGKKPGGGAGEGRGGSEGKGDLGYKLLNLGLTALGASALMDNTVLHIIPQLLDIDASSSVNLGKGCVMLAGLYAFYLLEFVLHSFTGHSHSHGGGDDDHGDHGNDHPEVTIPHGSCKDEEAGATMVHPRRGRDEDCTQHKYGSLPPDERKENKAGSVETEASVFVLGGSKDGGEKPANGDVDEDHHLDSHSHDHAHDHDHAHSHGHGRGSGWCSPYLLLLVADTLHILADGVALGASVSHSLTLGLTTSFALLFHELPHMFGDYSILFRMKGGLLRTVFPFLAYMSLVAFVGFFVGASIGIHCMEANMWVLSLASGFFLYVGLVNLLPELINGVPRGRIRVLAILVIGLCFSVTFAVFITFAVYQNTINVPL